MTTPETTPPLNEFLAQYEADDNCWWGMGCGHHQNLFEAAVERAEEAEGKLLQLEQTLLNLGDSVETLLNLADLGEQAGSTSIEIQTIREMLRP